MRKLGFIVALVVLSFGNQAKANPILVGSPGVTTTQDCVPFGCALNAQFVYDASYFSGPVAITGLTFFNSVDDPDTFDPGTYTFSLSTTSSSSTAPSSTYANNRGGDFQTFDVEILSLSIASTFTFTGTPFNYNPVNGNLLLEVNKDCCDNFSGFTDYNSGGGFLVSRVWGNDSTSGTVDINYGPVTQFETEAIIPEPATLTLTGLGLIGVVSRRLRKRRKSSTPTA